MNYPLQIEGHVAVVHREQGEYKAMVKCSCGQSWSVFQKFLVRHPDDQARVQESIKSHHISVGLKPTEVL